MKIRFLLLFCLFSGMSLSAQDDDYYGKLAADTTRGGWRYVISPDGLNLRSLPDLKSKVLRKILFNEKVQLVSPEHFGRDTIGQLEYFSLEGQPYQQPIDGFWLKVRYKQTEGYMFSAYLGWTLSELREEEKMLNQDFVLLFAEIGCNNNVFYRPDWHWYGVYKQDADWLLKNVKVSFYNIPMDMMGDVISTNDNRNLQFILGSRKPLTEKVIRSKDGFERGIEDKPLTTYNGKLLVDSTLKQYNLTILRDEGQNYWDTQKLVFQRNGRRQEMKLSSYDGTWNLQWCGDLDGDGLDDYIIRFGEQIAKTILFLSKSASKGQLIKPVAVYYSGYCC